MKVKDPEDITHEYSDEITCRWCGHEWSDSWDCGVDESSYEEFECEECGHEFEATLNIAKTYSTYRKDCEDGNHQYEVCEYSPYTFPNDKNGSSKNWCIYVCKVCQHEVIKTSPVAEDGKPYIIPLTKKEDNQ